MFFWKDLPIPMLIEKPNFNETVEIYSKYTDNMKRHLLVALIKNTPPDVLKKVKHAFNKFSNVDEKIV